MGVPAGGLACALDAGYKPVMILGSDSPTLPASHIRRLLECDADIALGPAEDGGFWGIAARRIHPSMFDGVAWSTPRDCRGPVVPGLNLFVLLLEGLHEVAARLILADLVLRGRRLAGYAMLQAGATRPLGAAPATVCVAVERVTTA